MGPSSRSFAAEAHLLLHGPGPARIQPNTRLRRELRAQLAGSPRFVPVCQHPLCTPAFVQLDRRKPIQALTLAAGIVTIIEHTYQAGDWIELDGTYGEVKAIGIRAVHIVTADDTEVIIPHARLWSTSVFNASGGKQSLLCVTNFYLRANHDGASVRLALSETAETSSYRKPETPVKVVAAETPWGTHYKIKAYVTESREQFAMITDLTIRGKERLRTMGVAFAQAPYAQGASG